MPKKRFEPSRQTLLRVLETIKNNQSTDKTDLSAKANLNYSRLARHIIWLEEKKFVKSVIVNGKINIKLTEEGMQFYISLNNSKVDIS